MERYWGIIADLSKKVYLFGKSLQKDVPLSSFWSGELAKLPEKVRPIVDTLLRMEVEMDWAADAEDLSLKFFDEGEEYEGEHVTFPGGYSQILSQFVFEISFFFFLFCFFFFSSHPFLSFLQHIEGFRHSLERNSEEDFLFQELCHC
jgi:hypothetical protein